MKRVYTVEEVALRLSVSVDDVMELIESNTLAAANIGGQWRVSDADLQVSLLRMGMKKVGHHRMSRGVVGVCCSLLVLGVLVPVLAFDLGDAPTLRTTSNVPRVLPYHGQYYWNNKPFNGNVIMSFSLYSSPEDGSALWTSSKRGVAVENGAFSVVLGDVNDATPIRESAFFSRAIYVEVSINDKPLSPRQRLAPAAQSVVSGVAWSALNAKQAAPESILARQVQSASPIGSIIAFAGTDVPAGWLRCDGSARKIQEYPDLGVALVDPSMNRFVWGDGTTGACLDNKGNPTTGCNFNLPDLRGVFLRGANMGRDDDFADKDAAGRIAGVSGGSQGDSVGSFQRDALQQHRHGVSTWPGSALNQINTNHLGGYGVDMVGTPGDVFTNPSVDGRTAFETRPVNASVHYLIKFE